MQQHQIWLELTSQQIKWPRVTAAVTTLCSPSAQPLIGGSRRRCEHVATATFDEVPHLEPSSKWHVMFTEARRAAVLERLG